MGLVCSRVEVAAVVAGSCAGCQGGNGCGARLERLQREGAACVCAREVGVVMGLMNGKKEKERKITHLSWRAAGSIYACDACEDGYNEVAGVLAKGGVMAGSRWRWL